MKKCSKKYFIFVILAMTLITTLFTSCNNNDTNGLNGTWSVVSYEYNDNSYTSDEISEAFGSDFAELYNNVTMTFYSDSTVNIRFSSEDNTKLTYKSSGNEISFYDDTDDIVMSMENADTSIIYELNDSHVSLIFEKQ